MKTFTRYPQLAPTATEDFLAVVSEAKAQAPLFVNETVEDLAHYVDYTTDSIMEINAGKCHRADSVARLFAAKYFAGAAEYCYRTQFELVPSGD